MGDWVRRALIAFVTVVRRVFFHRVDVAGRERLPTHGTVLVGNHPNSLVDPVRTLTATIAAELGETVEGDTHYRVLFLIGVVLFAVTFVVNLIADIVVKGVRSEKAA